MTIGINESVLAKAFTLDVGGADAAMSQTAASMHMLAAVDSDIGPGYKTCIVRAQIPDKSRDFIWLAQTTGWNLRQDL